MKLICNLAVIVLAACLASPAAAELITEWNFNAENSPGSASTGTGTSSGSFFPFTSTLPDNSGSSADMNPVIVNGGPNNSNASRTGPQPGEASGTRIMGFETSTAGYTDISIEWDMTAAYRSSRYYQLTATSDGMNYNPVSGGIGSAGSTPGVGSYTIDTFGLITVSFDDGYVPNPDPNTTVPVDYLFDVSYAFPSGSAFENNPNFGFEIAAIHAPTGNDFISSFAGTTSADPVAGYERSTTRYDLVQVSGVFVPEPTGLAFTLLGLLGVSVLRRR